MALERQTTLDGYVTEKVDVLKSNLLGEYNTEGKYMISQSIVAELVNIRKYKRNAFNNSVYCVSQSKAIGEICFEIIFKKNSKSKVGSATLSILEPVKKINGYVQNTIKTPVAIYKTTVSSTFVDDACRAFNVVINIGENYEYDSERLDEQLYIQAKKELNHILGVVCYNDYDALYKDYFEKRMEIVKNLKNPFMQEILEEFEKEKIKKFFLENEAGIEYKTLNELLDKIMEWYFGMSPSNKKYEDEYRNNILPFMRTFILQASTIDKVSKLNAPKSFPRNKKEVLEKTLQDVKNIQEDRTPQASSPKVIDKSPDAKVEESIKPIVKEKPKTENPLVSEFAGIKNILETTRESKASKATPIVSAETKITATLKPVENKLDERSLPPIKEAFAKKPNKENVVEDLQKGYIEKSSLGQGKINRQF